MAPTKNTMGPARAGCPGFANTYCECSGSNAWFRRQSPSVCESRTQSKSKLGFRPDAWVPCVRLGTLVSRRRSSLSLPVRSVANFCDKRDTRIIGLLVWLCFGSSYRCQPIVHRNFRNATLDRCPDRPKHALLISYLKGWHATDPRGQRIGGAYCRPPCDHCAFRPRAMLRRDPAPTLRSKDSP